MNFKNILCPVDFSMNAEAGLLFAEKLAKESDAKLHLVYVYEEPQSYVDAGFGGYVVPADLESEKKRLQAVVPNTPGIAYEHGFIVGLPAEELVRYAREHAIDLIVMGTHGRTGLGRLLMGSVAESVVREAPCPVLTIKQPAEVPAKSSD